MGSPVEQIEKAAEKLLENNSYLIKESTPDRAYRLLSERVSSGYKGLCITRTSPADIKKSITWASPLYG